jgi:hypothetical protein
MAMYGRLEQDRKSVPLIPVAIFTAFAIEAYLNSLGSRKLPFWDEVERLPWRNKVAILHKAADRPMDWSKDPLQFASEVFSLRDRLAHGKPERVLGPVFEDEGRANAFVADIDLMHKMQPEWFNKLTFEWVMQGKERFRVLMTYLGSLFGFHESDHLMHSTGGMGYTDDSE